MLDKTWHVEQAELNKVRQDVKQADINKVRQEDMSKKRT